MLPTQVCRQAPLAQGSVLVVLLTRDGSPATATWPGPCELWARQGMRGGGRGEEEKDGRVEEGVRRRVIQNKKR